MLRSLIGLLCLCMTAGMAVASPSFSFDTVVDKARERAQNPWQAPPQVPKFLQELDYSRYQEIRFKPEESLWQDGGSKFQVMLTPAGNYFRHAVALNVVNSDGVHPIAFAREKFTYPSEEFAKRIPADLGYAGFRLTFPLAGPDIANQFLSFAGASYFRGVARDQRFGVSARGIAVDTGLPSGEEFPSFVEFWLERPAADAEQMVVYGLLDGPSLTGAYRFTVAPGDTLNMKVESRLFFRSKVKLAGYAPLTSMFYYGENTIRPGGEWRPQAHDSDGLLIHDGENGEWLWRPLTNPNGLKMSYLKANNPRGFGLLQRDRNFHQFQDLEARYDQRPSAWVEPRGDWGEGNVVLVEIPTRSEVNDNIVAFWAPSESPEPGGPVVLNYDLKFGAPGISGLPTAASVNTFVGDGNRVGGGNVEGAYRIVVDFAGGPLGDAAPGAAVVSHVSAAGNTEVLEHFVEYVEPEDRWRLSMLVRPVESENLALRAYLSLGEKPVTETWTYELPPGTDIRAL